jgi:hypothetical protein
MYRDQIQLRQLSDFKLCPSGEEIIIHHHLMNAQPLLEKQLLQAEKWCNKLIETNHKLCLYHENFLFLFLEKRLLEVMQKRHINNNSYV